MATPTSRRAFLMGRRPPASPWDLFCARLVRTCSGNVRIAASSKAQAGVDQAWLEPVRHVDVAHARALCQEYGVTLALAGCARSGGSQRATLWVTPLAHGATFSPVKEQAGCWRVDAGCTIAQVQETGIFEGLVLAPELTLAQWFAGVCAPQQRVSLEAARIVERAEVLLADGTLEVLGPFGSNAQTPLRSLALQRLVPKLFELAGSEEAQLCAQASPWPALFRLDALFACATQEPNLAQLLFGHQGRLGWVQTLWLRRLDTPPAQGHTGCVLPDLQLLASQLDQELKHILDPLGVFGVDALAKGLESGS